MNDYDSTYSRSRRFEKKRKNRKLLIIFISIAVVGLLLIVGSQVTAYFMFQDENASDAVEETTTDENSVADDDQGEDAEGISQPDSDEETAVEDEDESVPETEAEQAPSMNPNDYELTFEDSAEVENVISSYTANWPAIKTAQSEPHVTSWEQDSVDWQEMLKAATLATDVLPADMLYLWVSGSGADSVTATFTKRGTDEHFRVNIDWIKNQGWQPQQVHLLMEHDQMNRFESDQTEVEANEDTDSTKTSE